MNNVSRSLIIAGSGNQVPPGPPPKIWTPTYKYNPSYDPRPVNAFSYGFDKYYSGSITKLDSGGLVAADSKPQLSPYLTRDDYLNYLKTIHPWAKATTGDGALAAVPVSLDFWYNIFDQDGHAGLAMYWKGVPITGTNPAGSYVVTLMMGIYYDLKNP